MQLYRLEIDRRGSQDGGVYRSLRMAELTAQSLADATGCPVSIFDKPHDPRGLTIPLARVIPQQRGEQ